MKIDVFEKVHKGLSFVDGSQEIKMLLNLLLAKTFMH